VCFLVYVNCNQICFIFISYFNFLRIKTVNVKINIFIPKGVVVIYACGTIVAQLGLILTELMIMDARLNVAIP
jgi:hypothetical protein